MMTSNRNNIAVIHELFGDPNNKFSSAMYSVFLMSATLWLSVAWRGGNISAETVVWITILYNLL